MGLLSDLVHCKADGLHVQALLPQLPSVLLHQSDHHAAHVVIIVSVLQLQLELRVGPECVCGWKMQSFRLGCKHHLNNVTSGQFKAKSPPSNQMYQKKSKLCTCF